MQHVQEISLDLNQHGYVSINAKQGDQNGRFIRIHLTENGTEVKPGPGVTAEFRAVKKDGKSIDNPATIEEGGTILACLTDQTLAVAGEVLADISLKEGDAIVSTLNFLIYVEPAPLGNNIPSTNEFGTMAQATREAAAAAGEARAAAGTANTAAGAANTAAGTANTATGRANDAAALIEDMTVTASEVEPGGQPTAKLTKQDGHYDLDLGIPRGKPGEVRSVNGGTGDVIIGGTNLLTGSRDFSGGNWYSGRYHVFDVLPNDVKWEKAEPYKGFTVAKATFLYSGIAQHSELVGNKHYVFSLYVKADRVDGEGPIRARMWSSNNSYGTQQFFNPTSEWKRYSFQYFPTTDLKSDSDVDDFPHVELCENGGENCTIYVCGFKLEEGTVATDWSPAPEDIPSMAPVQSVNGETGDVTVKKLVSSVNNIYSGSEVTLNGDASNEYLKIASIKKSDKFDRVDIGISKANGQPFFHLIKDGAIVSGSIGSQRIYTSAFPQPSSEAIIAQQLADGTYEGVDLTVRHAAEIAGYTDPWAWVRARIKAKDYSGIHVWDYIPFACTNNHNNAAVIMGINTYKYYHSSGDHIDFITRDVWPVKHAINKVDFNNGVSNDNITNQSPYLCSDHYLWLNSHAGNVPSAAVVGGTPLVGVDYTQDGVWYYLPSDLQSAIDQSKRKYMQHPRRYSASGLLTGSTGSDEAAWDRLWMLYERELLDNAPFGNMWDMRINTQYPLFANNLRRDSQDGKSYLLASASNNNNGFLYVHSTYGTTINTPASNGYLDTKFCFRLTA